MISDCLRSVLAVLIFLGMGAVRASDGQIEISQACATVGCFAGDTANFPVTIANPGSYILTSNLQHSTANTNIINITSSGVVLDLNGFTMDGPGPDNSFGIQIGADRVEIRNGSIIDVGYGIYSLTDQGSDVRVVDLNISSLGGTGIYLKDDALVDNCRVLSKQTAISTEEGAVITHNRVGTNGGSPNATGIFAHTDALVANNVITGVTGAGIQADATSIISSNVVRGSGTSGILISGFRTLVSGNNVTSSQNYGIQIDSGSHHLIRGNLVQSSNQSGGSFTDFDDCGTCTFIDNHVP